MSYVTGVSRRLISVEPAHRVDYAGLTPFERELLSYVLDGLPNKVIAQHLGVTETNAKVELGSLFRKINVESRTQATIWALSNLPELHVPLAAWSGSACKRALRRLG
jgi:DNA-binding NarL/FixJ family response regulator